MPRTLPSDCTFLPTQRGVLLVSPSHATFCGLDADEAASLQNKAPIEDLAPSTVSRLEAHGFFGEPRQLPTPKRTVSLQLTNACNLRCEYCCTNSLHPRDEELDLDSWKRVVDDARASFGAGVRFAILGGEPLIVPHALDLAEYISKLDVHLAIYTNGIELRRDDVAERVARLIRGGVEEVRVSLAGATRETCDKHSGMPRFDRVLAGLRNLAGHGATALVDLMLFPDDVAEVATNLPALRQMLPRGTHISFGLGYHGGRESGGRVFATRGERESALDRIVLEAGEEIAAAPAAPVTDRRDGCSCALGHSLNVRSDGRLFSCFRMEECVGDLKTTTFGETLVTLRAKPRPAKEMEPCSTCALVSLCGGGCRSENLLFMGDAERPVCGPWRVQVMSELLAEDRVSCLEWSAVQLAGEARSRGIPAPEIVRTVRLSRHLED